MTNEVLFELWTTKDNIAKEHDYNIDSLVAYFRQKQDQKFSSTDTSSINAEQKWGQNTILPNILKK